ncbi:MAG: hypothetical protein HS113_12555 [Verrucomicrobiales bacterium]|nr:hypothetical protein [Verrucomicrobiales bacterium]
MMGSTPRLLWAHALLLVSGTCGLGYQMLWTRWFGLGLGQELPALLAVVAAFFGGCALGAGMLDGPIRRSPRPALWYAGLEVLIGVWAWLSIWLIPATQHVALDVMGLEPSGGRQAVVAFGLPFLVLLPATAAMGASFPAMECFVRGHVTAGRVVGSLYAASTLGAVVGTLAGVFVLVPGLGFTGAVSVLGWLNLACAAGLLVLARTARNPARAGEGAADPRPGGGLAPPGTGSGRRDARTTGSGEVALAPGPCAVTMDRSRRHEEADTRAPASSRRRLRGDGSWEGKLLALLLATGLLGIGFEVVGVRLLKGVLENTVFTFASVLAVYLVGTALGAGWAGRVARFQPLEEKLAWLLGGLGVACAVGGWAMVMAPEVYRGLRGAVGDSLGGVMAAEGLVAASVFFLPTLLMGATFATLAEAVRDRRGSVGRALAWNTVGGMLAPLLLGALLFPWLGGKWTVVVLVTGYALLWPGRRTWRLAVARGGALVLALALPDLDRTGLLPGERLRTARAGIADSVAVVETAEGHRTLRVNNRFTMGGTASAPAEGRQAHLPLLLHPAPRRVLFLGSGTGITAAAATAHPGVFVDSVELAPEVVQVMGEFAPENFAPPGRLRQHVADARRFVRVTTNRYDVIVADLFHPARDGAGALYTREHYEAIARRLAGGGLFCQWIPLYQVDLETLGWMAASVAAAFPHVHAILLRPTVDTPVLGLLGAFEPHPMTLDALDRRLEEPGLREALQPLGLTDAFQILQGYLGPGTALLEGAAPDTDDRQRVNWRASRWGGAGPRWPYDTLFAVLGRSATTLDRLLPDVDEATERRFHAVVRARNRYLEGLRLEAEGDLAEARRAWLESAAASDDFTYGYAHLLTLAVQLSRDQPAEARRLFDGLIQARPERPVARELRDRLVPLR